MKKTLAAVAAVLALTGCATQPTTPTPSTPAPSPVDTAHRAYLDALTAIDTGLTVNTERALRRGRAVCDAFTRYQGDQAKIVDYTRQEYDGGNATVDAGKAGRIVAAIQATGICR